MHNSSEEGLYTVFLYVHLALFYVVDVQVVAMSYDKVRFTQVVNL